MKYLIIYVIFLYPLLLFSQRDTTWIPFQAKIIDNKDTIKSGFNFYLQNKTRVLYPYFNSKFNYFEFSNTENIMDFHLFYKKRHFVLCGIETVRLMYNHEWEIFGDTLSPDSCYTISVKNAGCFNNVIIGGHISLLQSNCLDIWISDIMSEKIVKKQYKRHRKHK